MGHGLDDLGAGDEKLALSLDHEDEVHEGGAVSDSPGATAEDGRNQRNHPGGLGQGKKMLSKPIFLFPSWIRAPTESCRATTGTFSSQARRMRFAILAAWTLPNDPPWTVLSWA